MGAKVWLGGMIAGSFLFIAAVPERRDPPPPPEPRLDDLDHVTAVALLPW